MSSSKIEPKKISYLAVSGNHTLYVEQSGNLKGIPVVYLHGGPGAASTASTRELFNPDKFHIVQYDQRGCGKSKPHASIDQNTTWELVDDLETIREHCGFDQWLVCGGSWGSTLALAYAQKYTSRVSGLILRGLFLGRQKEIDWLYLKGASELFPEYFEAFVELIPVNERNNLIGAYFKNLISPNREEQIIAARAWCRWEVAILAFQLDDEFFESLSDEFCLAMAKIGCHFFLNKFFLKEDDQLLKNLDKLRKIPTVIIQGRYDLVTPMSTAWSVKKVWPEAKLIAIGDAGHAVSEPGITKAILSSTETFSKHSKFD